MENWTELVTVQTFPGKQADMTAREAMLRTKKWILKQCPDTTWNVIAQSEEAILYEWRTTECPGYGSEYEVSKLIRGKMGIHRLAYANKELPISQDRRNRWIDLIERAKLELGQYAHERLAAVKQPSVPPPSQPSEQATGATPYKIAIFPFESEDTSQYGPRVPAAISDKLSKFIQSDSSFTLAYSFYSDGYSRDRVRKTDKLWVGGAVRKKPNLALLYATARKLGVDGIVMAFREGSSWGSPDPEGWTLELYLIGVDRQQVYYSKGRIRNTEKLIRRVFADFAKSRPQAVATVAPAGAATATAPPAPSAAPATTTALAPTTIAIDAPVTRPDKERELLRSIAGKWRGDGISARGTAYSITYIFREDGSFNISWRWGTNADRGQYPPGTLRVIGSHFEHKNPDGRLWTITLHKDKKGRRRLKGRRQDGNKWELKEQK